MDENKVNDDVAEHAWEYFKLHAGQRLTTFNFYLVLSTVILGGLLTVLKDLRQPKFAALLSLSLPALSFVFWKLDRRTKELIKHGEAALKWWEERLPLPATGNNCPHEAAIFRREEFITDHKRRGFPLFPWTWHLSYSKCFDLVFLFFAFSGVGLAIALWNEYLTVPQADQKCRSLGEIRANAVDIAVVTILPEEYEAVLRRLDSHERASLCGGEPDRYGWEIGLITPVGGGRPYRIVLALAGQAGNVSGLAATQATLEQWSPKSLLLVGIAGGLPREELALGDVVVSTVIWGYEYGTLEELFLPRGDFTYPISGPLVRNAQTLAARYPAWASTIGVPAPNSQSLCAVKMVAGPMASGDKVIEDTRNEFFTQVLKKWPRLQAIEMEGAGAAFAIQASQEKGHATQFLMIRGISDMPNTLATNSSEKNAAVRKEWKQFASASAASFTYELIHRYWPFAPGAE